MDAGGRSWSNGAEDPTVIELGAHLCLGCVPEGLTQANWIEQMEAGRPEGVSYPRHPINRQDYRTAYTCRPAAGLMLYMFLFDRSLDGTGSHPCFEWGSGVMIPEGSTWVHADGTKGGTLYGQQTSLTFEYKLCWSDAGETIMCVAYCANWESLLDWWLGRGMRRVLLERR